MLVLRLFYRVICLSIVTRLLTVTPVKREKRGSEGRLRERNREGERKIERLKGHA